MNFSPGLWQGTIPKLTAKSNCRFEIEWVTEYACHRDYLESQSCSLSSAQHDVAVDLQPLSRVGGEWGGPEGQEGPRAEHSLPRGGRCRSDGRRLCSPRLVRVAKPLLVCPPFLNLRLLVLHFGGR